MTRSNEVCEFGSRSCSGGIVPAIDEVCQGFAANYDARMLTTVNPSARRKLHFDSLDEVVADVKTLAAADSAGRLTCCGNWTFGQILNHLATWVDYSFDGVPMKIPLLVRWMIRPMKKRFLTKPMRPNSRIPKVAGGTLAIDVVPTTEALEHFYRSFERLAKGPPAIPHMLFGPMTHDEWIAQHLRHSELHLSFLTVP